MMFKVVVPEVDGMRILVKAGAQEPAAPSTTLTPPQAPPRLHGPPAGPSTPASPTITPEQTATPAPAPSPAPAPVAQPSERVQVGGQQQASVGGWQYPFVSQDQLQQKQGHRVMGYGGYGAVHYDPEHSKSVMYGNILPNHASIAKQAGALEVGPQTDTHQEGGAHSAMAVDHTPRHKSAHQLAYNTDTEEYDYSFKHLPEHEKKNINSYRQGLANIVRGVGTLHKNKIHHGDLNPGNVKIGPDGHGQIADYGLAGRHDVGKMIDDIAPAGHGDFQQYLEGIGHGIRPQDALRLQGAHDDVKALRDDQSLSDDDKHDRLMGFHGKVNKILDESGLPADPKPVGRG